MRVTFITLVLLFAANLGVPSAHAQGRLDSWKSCCGAVCLRVVAGILDKPADLAQIRDSLDTNDVGETSLAEILKTATMMGFYTKGLSIRSDKLQECSVPLIAHLPPNHFVVLLGQGKNRGVLIIDPPHVSRQLKPEELEQQKYWNVIAIHTSPISTDASEGHDVALSGSEGVNSGVSTLASPDNVWNFGKVVPNRVVTHTFRIKNGGTERFEVRDAQVSCPCLSVETPTSTIEVGDELQVNAKLDTTGLQGRIRKTAVVTIVDVNSQNERRFIFDVHAEVSRRGALVSFPARVVLPTTRPATNFKTTVLVNRVGNEYLHLKRVSSNSSSVKAVVISGSERAATEVRIELSIDVPPIAGPYNYEVIIDTDDSDHPTLSVPIHGEIASPYSLSPPQLFMSLKDGESDSATKVVSIKNRSGSEFAIVTVRSDIDGLQAVAKQSPSDAAAWDVEISSTASLPHGVFKGTIHVVINDPDIREIEIPIIGILLPTK